MQLRSRISMARILGFLLIGPAVLLVLAVLAYLHFKLVKTGISGFISQSFALKPIRQFGLGFGLRILLPIYIGAGVLAWLCAFIPGRMARPTLLKDWTGREAMGLGCSALLWAHLVLWWEVPTTLWVLPGLRLLPFIILFPLLLALVLAYPLHWLYRAQASGGLKSSVLALWLCLWTGMALAPRYLPRPKPQALGGNQPCKVLILGIDALRSDVFLQNAENYRGVRYQNAYTVIPATRLLWHILWGGDPLTYTIGHAAPSEEEFRQPHELVLLRKAMQDGLRPRFYIDDGGTIGIAGRRMDLDDVLMPATGWENFVNSNLAVSFPLYAAWENYFKPFPTTNPWATLDAGVREALRLGRGSGWVMFHSCLCHQPVFLTRRELGGTGRWWTLAPLAYEPLVTVDQVTRRDLLHPDPRTNPFLAYQIRMRSILDAWRPVWNGLAQDPQYRQAVRILFSDHGERFHYVGPGFQLQGEHGFNLDPWECRSTLLVAGPGFSDAVNPTPRQATVSILGLREGIARVLRNQAFDAPFLESCTPKAPFRYHTLSTEAFGAEPLQYRAEPENDLAINTYLAPGGIWFTSYRTSAKERAKDASVGYGEGPVTTYLKPLVGGGAEQTTFRYYQLTGSKKVDEKTFQATKKEVEDLLRTDTRAIQ